MPSIFIAELSHETNTFCPVPTDMSDFMPDRTTLLVGHALIEHYRGTNTAVGGS